MEDKITTRTIDAVKTMAKRSGKEQYVWDTELQGFGMRVSPLGKVTWRVQKWQGGRGGKAVKVRVGHCPPMELSEARKEAGDIIAKLSKGLDVETRKDRLQAHREKQAIPSLSEAVERYLDKKAKPNSEYWGEVKRKLQKEVIPTLGKDTRVDRITKADVRRIIEAKEDKGMKGAARYMYAVLNPFMKWCAERDYIASNPMATLAKPEILEARDRVLSAAEIKAFWKASDHLPLFGPLYKLLLLTAQRRDEVAGIQWSEINAVAREWTIPKERTKNGKAHIVHLCSMAFKVIEATPRGEGEYLFSTTQTTPVSGFTKAKERLDELMAAELEIEPEELKPWRIHDLRRTAATGMQSVGVAPHIIERVLNHVSGENGGLKGVYQKHEYINERRAALIAWGLEVQRVVNGNGENGTASNVVALRG